MVRPNDKQIEEMLVRASAWRALGKTSAWGEHYEGGVEDALRWVLGEWAESDGELIEAYPHDDREADI